VAQVLIVVCRIPGLLRLCTTTFWRALPVLAGGYERRNESRREVCVARLRCDRLARLTSLWPRTGTLASIRTSQDKGNSSWYKVEEYSDYWYQVARGSLELGVT
jgi:hypothetical protein